MHDEETRALKRAVVILCLVSTARWGWARTTPPAKPPDETVLPELLAESADEADEQERRRRPLAEGERIDPNRADEIELDRLPRIGPATARAIIEAREEGLIFLRPSDLERVPGVGPATVAELANLLDLDDPPARARRAAAAGPGPPTRDEPRVVNVNRASVDALVTLPGIGPALAERIVAERRKRMFRSVEDLARVPGIGPATLARLEGLVRVDGRD